MEIRKAHDSEIEALAKLWYDGWQAAHAYILPADLARYRTPESFGERMTDNLDQVRVCGPFGEPLGFTMTRGDELYQLYVSADARGQGVAQALVADAEFRLAAQCHNRAWLACAIGNERAARFYEKSGWVRQGVFENTIELPDQTYKLEVWRYEKELTKVIEYKRANLALMRELNDVFAVAFEDAEHYQSAKPSDLYLNKLLANPDFIPIVATIGGKVVGGLAAYVLHKFEKERSEIYIYDLAVDENYRRRHIATGCINKLREIARETTDAWVIYVQADPPDEPAVKLYESLGIREDVLHFDIEP